MQISSTGTPARADAPATTSSASHPERDDGLAEAFAALLGAPGALVSGPTPNWGAGSGQAPTAFDGERQVAEEDARRQAPGRPASQAATPRPTSEGEGAEVTEAAPTPASSAASRPSAAQDNPAVPASRTPADTPAEPSPPASLLAATASARQLQLQRQASASGSPREAQAAAGAEKLSASSPPEMAQTAFVSQVASVQVDGSQGRSGGTSPASTNLEMTPATPNARSSADAPTPAAPTASLAATASPLLERVSQIVSSLAQQPQQQVTTRIDLGGGEQLGVVFRLRDQQLNVTFVTANRGLRQALNGGWDRVRAHGQSLGLGIRDAAFTEPTPLS